MRERARDFSEFWLHDIDPVLIQTDALEIRLYTVCFFLMLVTGYLLWRSQMLRAGYSVDVALAFLPYGVVGVILGGRIVHCLFYEPDFYLDHPIQILNLGRGGLASHGSVLGLLTGLWLYRSRFGVPLLEAVDRLGFALMPAGAFVRLGNFLNSGIVGKEWEGPFAVRFQRFAAQSQALWERENGPLGWSAEPLPRHPVQLYEGMGMLVIFAVLLAVDRRLGETRPRGLMVGLVVTLYFAFRFGLEGLKEFQRFVALQPDSVDRVIRVVPTAELTMGQWLSIPGFVSGLLLIAYATRRRLPASGNDPS